MRCKTIAIALGWICCWGALLPARGVRAQGTAGLPEPKLTRQSVFSIPFRVTPARTPGEQPVEVQLFVSIDQGRSWQMDGRVLPSQGTFSFRGQRDGEYWFSIRTVDAQGQLHPSGPTAPGMRVIIDTVPPQLDLLAERGANGEVRARWQASDLNLAQNSFKLEYQTAPNQPWQPVSIEAPRNQPLNQLGGATTFWPQPNPQGVVVRATVLDRAGNPTIAQISVDQPAQAEAPNAAAPPAQNPPSVEIPNRGSTSQTLQSLPAAGRDLSDRTTQSPWNGAAPRTNSAPTNGLLPTNSIASGNRVAIPADPFPSNGVVSNNQKWNPNTANRNPLVVDNPLAKGNGVSTIGGNSAVGANPPTMPDRYPIEPRRETSLFTPTANERVVGNSIGEPGNDRGGNRAANLSPTQAVTPGVIHPTTESPPPLRPPLGANANSGPLGPQLTAGGASGAAVEIPPGEEPRRVNSTKFELAYDLDTAAGAAHVELYGTRDGGKTWSSYGQAPANSSSGSNAITVRVNEEGTYGFRLAAHSAAAAGAAPRPGDLPEVWVVVDTTKPQARLTSAEMDAPNSTLTIRWEASDAKLSPRPVALFFAPSKSGHWTPIASGLENSGNYAWKLDRRVPEQAYLRLEVSDEAGNLTAVESADPVSIGGGQPIGRIRGVRPLSDDGATAKWQTWR
ncbi:MAG TPA: hypothetical protein VFE24_01780 [Pirellulales bacterium]|jgi:hypothetical protein|nr:hypothetical protein [Pirellulales bacterium]